MKWMRTVAIAEMALVAMFTALAIAVDPWWAMSAGTWAVSAWFMWVIYLRRLRINGYRRAGTHSGDSDSALDAGGCPRNTAGGSSGAGAGSSMTDVLPREIQVDALHGWRLARLVASKSTVSLLSLNTGGTLSPEANAQCHAYDMGFRSPLSLVDDHGAVPDLNCSCGFYALKDRDGLSCGPGHVVLEVELSGRIVEATNGFRAQHQRILACHLPSVCDGGFLCDEPAEVLVFPLDTTAHTQYVQNPGFGNPGGIMVPAGMPSVQSFPFYACCGKHAVDADRVARPAQLSNRLGVEMQWSE